MRIAVIGMGVVGTVLGGRWRKAGHDINYCVRDPDSAEKQSKAKFLEATISGIDGAASSEVILLSVPWAAVPEVLHAAGDLTGKIVLDCTNPVSSDFDELLVGTTTSAGEQIAALIPGAKVVKIFNTNGAANMADPQYSRAKVTMFFAGDDQEANRVAADLAAVIGFKPVEMGPLKAARILEPLAFAWITLARHRGWGDDFALDAVRRFAS